MKIIHFSIAGSSIYFEDNLTDEEKEKLREFCTEMREKSFFEIQKMSMDSVISLINEKYGIKLKRVQIVECFTF